MQLPSDPQYQTEYQQGYAGQVQRELTQQSEEELQKTLADVHRAANLGDPELTGDAMIVVRFLVKNNLLGGVVR